MGRYSALDYRIRRLEKEQARREASVQNQDDYAFRLSPTCPPSTSIIFHGGLAWQPAYVGYPAGFFIPTYTVDLSDTSKTVGEFQFSNAGWYKPVLIGIENDLWPPPVPPATWPDSFPDNCLRLYTGTEVETAAEAEAGVRGLIGDRVAYNGICAGGMVLRNNGDTANYNQFMPVDLVNRGRSYIFGNKKRYGWEMG